ncbi:hypothetical protein B0H15DRAFT_866610 [Mycena belliarum]|uniref:Uncharacterized protein n=1 Tax=Mycena belliarum TaxID=1033014 RepID=A0AAD6TPL0_9AGAR|nr:hypothetical protein B0H15DRAFT_866610 [Mycena belliae]
MIVCLLSCCSTCTPCTLPFKSQWMYMHTLQQFATITEDRDRIIAEVRADADNQAKINAEHVKALDAAQDQFRKITAKVALLSITAAPPFPTRPHSRALTRSRSRSRTRRTRSRSPQRVGRARSRSSDGNHVDAKRHQAAPLGEAEMRACIRMGPISMFIPGTAAETFKLQIDTALPDYVLPQAYFTKREGDYLIVLLPSINEARALKSAWDKHTVRAYKGTEINVVPFPEPQHASRSHGDSHGGAHNANASASSWSRSVSGRQHGGRNANARGGPPNRSSGSNTRT